MQCKTSVFLLQICLQSDWSCKLANKFVTETRSVNRSKWTPDAVKLPRLGQSFRPAFRRANKDSAL